MKTFDATLKSWGNDSFDQAFKDDVKALDRKQLPLQKNLTQSSYVSESEFDVVIINSEDSAEFINIKAGIFYSGIIAGSCCADDPSPVDELSEYCELHFIVNKKTAEVMIEQGD